MAPDGLRGGAPWGAALRQLHSAILGGHVVAPDTAGRFTQLFHRHRVGTQSAVLRWWLLLRAEGFPPSVAEVRLLRHRGMWPQALLTAATASPSDFQHSSAAATAVPPGWRIDAQPGEGHGSTAAAAAHRAVVLETVGCLVAHGQSDVAATLLRNACVLLDAASDGASALSLGESPARSSLPRPDDDGPSHGDAGWLATSVAPPVDHRASLLAATGSGGDSNCPPMPTESRPADRRPQRRTR